MYTDTGPVTFDSPDFNVPTSSPWEDVLSILSSSNVPKIFSIVDLSEPISIANKSHAHDFWVTNKVKLNNNVRKYFFFIFLNIITFFLTWQNY